MQWDLEFELPPGVGEQLGHYVYLYVDPRTGEPFYVGKGVGNRILAHFGDCALDQLTDASTPPFGCAAHRGYPQLRPGGW